MKNIKQIISQYNELDEKGELLTADLMESIRTESMAQDNGNTLFNGIANGFKAGYIAGYNHIVPAADETESQYFSTKDLHGEESRIMTIKKLGTARIHGEPELLIYFEGEPKPMGINATNAQAIATATGENVLGGWIGQSVAIYSEQVETFGEKMDALRIRSAESEG